MADELDEDEVFEEDEEDEEDDALDLDDDLEIDAIDDADDDDDVDDDDDEEIEESLDEELDTDDDIEEDSLDVLLARDPDEDLVRLDEEPRDGLTGAIPTIAADEFTCQSCFLVKRRAQLADGKQMICLDCA